MKKTLTALLLAGAAFTALPAQAAVFDFGGGPNPLNDTVFMSNANTATLTVAGPIPAGNQPQNIQCIICGTHQPQQDADLRLQQLQAGWQHHDLRHFFNRCS